jgi:hypothetical protein
VIAGPQWSDLTHAGAFVLGLVVGVLVVIRLSRVLVELLRRRRDD